VREELRPKSSSGVGIKSGWKAGNLNVVCGLGSRAFAEAIACGVRARGGFVNIQVFVTPLEGCVVRGSDVGLCLVSLPGRR
jgi:hypothetical protein